MVYHIPALLNESIEGLDIKPDGIYVDVTYGGGGHSMEILKRLKGGRLLVFDQDEDAVSNFSADTRVMSFRQNFRFLRNNLIFNGINSIDGLIADLGVSFHQFDETKRGFTFRHDAPLDMRMNQSGGTTAAILINKLPDNELGHLFREYGELNNWKRVTEEIVKLRSIRPILTAGDLLDAINRYAPKGQEHKFYAKVFQALRIAVNHETEYLKEMLVQALEMLRTGGRLVVITYHSLEDRLVKNFMKSGNFEGRTEKDFYGNEVSPFRLITRKGITPETDEISKNNRARSARLRIAEKI